MAALLRCPEGLGNLFPAHTHKDPKSQAFFRVIVLKVDHKGLGFREVVLSVD